MGSNCCKCANDKKNKHLSSNSSTSSGPWTRGDDQLLGERFSSTTQRGAVTLTVRNATVEDAGRYSLSAENDAGQTHSDLLLEVRTRPGDVPVFLRRLNDLAVKVGTRTRFLVEVRSPTQVKVSWEQEGKPILEGERFHLLHEGSFFCVDVAPVTLEDAGLWMCRAHNSNGTATCFCHLNVLVPKAYKAPHFIEELVALLTQQGTVSLECKVVGVPTPTLKWFKDNQEIKAGDVFALSANPADTTSLGTYTCEASNCMGRAYSTSRVHVLGREGSIQPADSIVPRGPPPVFSKELRNEKVKIGGKLTLECKVNVPPWPRSITWFNKVGQVGSGGRYHIMEDGLGSYSIEVDQVEVEDEGEWKCVATSDAGVKGISSCTVNVSYPKNYKKPKFLESLKAILTEEGLVSFECKVVGYPTPQLRWFKDGQELKPGDVYQLTGTNSLGSYCCIAKNCMGETSSTAELTVEDIQSQLNEEERLQLFSSNQPPRFLQGLKSLEAKITEHLRLTVQVSVSPQPAVAWYRDDEEVQDSERYKREQETKGFCHLTIKRLELMDQAEWRCVATNDYGQSVTSCFLKLIVPRHYKKPRFLENLRAVLSEEGAVNLECKVIGVPQPTLKWYKDGRELKPGDIHRIISGQDGTCCLGTYTCEATNCMGTVSSSASLLGFEDRAQVKPPEPLRPLPPPAAHLVRHPSLSTILEERTSQMHDTMTVDERAEVSFSFDGKEVSVSLYETPDLTEEEALQVVEMYAEELSEHISGLQEVKSLEHNVVELPPMRFVKETSTSGHLLMEAVVIDVSPEYYASAEDRTEADLDEFSITEDNGFMSPMVLTPEEMPFEKFTADFLERTIQPIGAGQKSVPVKPPRKRGVDASESSYHSFKEAKVSPEEDSSEMFDDALSSQKDKSQKESFGSAKSGTGEKQVAVTGVEQISKTNLASTQMEIDASLKESDAKSTEGKKMRKKSRSRSKSNEIQPAEKVASSDNIPVDLDKKGQKKILKKRKSTDSEKEDDSLREFEKRKSLKSEHDEQDVFKQTEKKGVTKKAKSSESEKEDDSLQEFESRKSLQRSEKDSDSKTSNKMKGYQKKPASDSSGREDDSLIEYEKRKISGDTPSEKVSVKTERAKIPLSKSISTDSSEKDEAFAMKGDTSEQSLSRKKRKKSVKKSGSAEKKDQTSETGVEMPPSSEAESIDRESFKGKKVVSTSDLDRMRSTSDLESIGDKSRAQEEEERSADFDTAEDSAYDKSEMSVLESLTHSIQEIQKGLAAVEEKIISESSEEPHSAKSSLSVIESLTQPINEIQRGLVKVEKIAEESEAGLYSPSSILETLKKPIEELQKNLAAIEQTNIFEQTSLVENKEESLLKKTSQTLLETVSQPLQELQKELTFIQQQAVIETGEETYSEMLQSFKPSLLVVEGGVEQTEGEFSSKLDELSNVTVVPQATYAQSVEELQKGLAQIRDMQVLQAEKSDSFVPLTVQDIEESLAETAVSLSSVGGFDLCNELQTYSMSLGSCFSALTEKAQSTDDSEIKDILISISHLISPLEQFKTVIEKCLMLVVENDKSTDPQVRSANMVLKATLESPVHALGNSLHLLEAVARSVSNKEIRGLGIKVLYKLSFPLEELKTTMKLVENLSEHTSIELLVTPVESLISTASVINPNASKEGFAENISHDGVIILQELDHSLGTLSGSLQSMTKSLHAYSSLSTLSSLTKPVAELQKNLHKIEKKIKNQEKFNQMSSSEMHSMSQELCKPLQAIRTEMSLALHEIELDQYSVLSLSAEPIQGDTFEFACCVVYQSLEQVHKSVLTCTEFVLSKSPSESLHIRYLLFALNELILPLNQLSSSLTKAKDLVLKEAPKLTEPNLGIQVVTSSTYELLDALSALQQHSSSLLDQPDSSVIQVLCTMAEPLGQVQTGLHKISEHIHEEDKQVLNINMLKTLAEPFKCLQKSLINISEQLDSELISQEIFLELKQPIQELQRSILVIQDQVSFEYGDEPATIESNIVTLQSLVQPLNALKKHFLEIEYMILDKTQSTSYSKENKNLHSIIRVNHDLQLKLSSIMVQENYLTKHSLDSLDMFPILQDLTSTLRDFENSLKRLDLVCQNESKPNIVVHNKLCETVNSFKSDVIDLQNRVVLASNKAMKDSKHPVHFFKKGVEMFLKRLTGSSEILMNCKLDETSIVAAHPTFFKHVSKVFHELFDYLTQMERLTESRSSFKEELEKESTDVSLVSSSDTIKDVNTIVEEISETRVSLESAEILSTKSSQLGKACQELQQFCEYLKAAEESIIENTLIKAGSSKIDKAEERQELVNAFSAMKIQLEKIETHVKENHEALESTKHLKYAMEVIQEHLNYGEEISEVYILQNLSGPLKTFKDTISKEIGFTISEVKESESVSVYLEKFEKSASDLELGLMKLEHALLNSTGDFSSLKNIDIDVLAHPIEELVHYINTIEEKQSSLDLSETLADQSSLSMLKTLAVPIREIQEGVIEIQEHIVLESSGKTPSGRSCAGILYEIAKPIRELRSGVALIQEQVVVMEADIEPLSDETRASSLQTLAAPVEELKKVLTSLIEQQAILFEPNLESMSEDISALKTIAKPVRELQNKLAAIETNQVMEGNAEPFSVKENLFALAEPIHVLQESIQQVENQLALETLGGNISTQTNVSLLKKVAKPLMEVAKGIAIIFEQQFVEVANSDENTIMSDLSTLANITDVSMTSGVLNVDEAVLLEQGISFKEDFPELQIADRIREKQLGVAVSELQQDVMEVSKMSENRLISELTTEKLAQDKIVTEIVHETCPPVVQFQQTLSQAETLSSDSRTLQLVDIKEASQEETLQIEIQEALSPVSNLAIDKQSLKTALVQDVSLNIAAQVEEQEVLSGSLPLSNEESLHLMNVQGNVVFPFVIEGELQQSLADVESLETEEDTLESISIQDTSFKIEPHVNIQQALSDVESFLITEKTENVAEIKEYVRAAVQNEAQQVLTQEERLESFEKSSDLASLGEVTPKLVAKTEIQQPISNIDILEITNQVQDKAVLHESSLEGAVQVELQQMLSSAESLNNELSEPKHSQAFGIEEVNKQVAIQLEIQQFISVAEEIQVIKEGIQAKADNEPVLNEAIQQEIQQLLSFAEEIQSIKESLKVNSIEEPLLHIATPSEMQQVLDACSKIETIKQTVEAKPVQESMDIKTGIQTEVEQILLTADVFKNIKESITAKITEVQPLGGVLQVEAAQVLSASGNLHDLQKVSQAQAPQEEPLKAPTLSEVQPSVVAEQSLKKDNLMQSAETMVSGTALIKKYNSQFADQTDIEVFIAVAEDIKTVKEALEAKIITEPELRIAAKQEMQQLVSVAEEIQTVVLTLQAKSIQEPILQQSTLSEIQQVLVACENIQNLKEALEVKSAKELKIKMAIQSELQQILSSAETLQNVKESITAKINQAELLSGIAQVETYQVLSTSSTLQDLPITLTTALVKEEPRQTVSEVQYEKQPEVSMLINESISDEKPLTHAVVLTEIQEFISVAEEMKTVKEALNAKMVREPQFKNAAEQEIQELLSVAEEIQSVVETLQIKTVQEPALKQTTQSEIQQVLMACDHFKNAKEKLEIKSVKELKLKTAIQSELQQILSSAEVLQNIQESISAKVSQAGHTSNIAQIQESQELLNTCETLEGLKTATLVLEEPLQTTVSLEAQPKIVPEKLLEENVSFQNLEIAKTKEVSAEESFSRVSIQADIQGFITVAEEIKTLKEAFQAKILTEPYLKKAAQQEIQQMLSVAEEIQVIREALQVKTVHEPIIQQATQTEIQQVLTVCDNIQEVKDALQSKSTKQFQLKTALESELQQILVTAEALQSIKESIKAKISEVQSLDSAVHGETQKVLSNKSQDLPVKSQADSIPNIKTEFIPLSEVKLEEAVEKQNISLQRKEEVQVKETESAQITALQDLTSINVSVQEKTHLVKVEEEIQKVQLNADKLKKDSFVTVDQDKTTLQSVSKTDSILPSDKQKDTQQEAVINEEMYQQEYLQDGGEATAKTSLLIASQEFIQEILGVVENLDSVTEVLKSKVIQEPSLRVALESQIQQILLTTDSVSSLKESIQARNVTEPQVQAAMSAEMQQVLTATENLKVVQEVLQAKSAMEPHLRIAETILPQVLLTTQQLQSVCQLIQGKIVQEQSFLQAAQHEYQEVLSSAESLQKETEPVMKPNLIQEPSVKVAAQVELQQSLLSANEVHSVNDSAKATCTHEPCIQIFANKSGVASFIAEEDKSAEAKVITDNEKGSSIEISVKEVIDKSKKDVKALKTEIKETPGPDTSEEKDLSVKDQEVTNEQKVLQNLSQKEKIDKTVELEKEETLVVEDGRTISKSIDVEEQDKQMKTSDELQITEKIENRDPQLKVAMEADSAKADKTRVKDSIVDVSVKTGKIKKEEKQSRKKVEDADQTEVKVVEAKKITPEKNVTEKPADKKTEMDSQEESIKKILETQKERKDEATNKAGDSKEEDKLIIEKKVTERPANEEVEVDNQKKTNKVDESKDKRTDKADGSKEVEQLKIEKKVIEKPEDKKVEVDSQKKADKTEQTKKEMKDKITDKADDSKEVDKLKTEKKVIEKLDDKKVEVDSQKKADKAEETKKETKDKITDKGDGSKEVDKLKTEKKAIEKTEDKNVEADSQKKAVKIEEIKKESKDKITDKGDGSKEVDKLKTEKKAVEKTKDKNVEVDSQKKADKTEQTKRETKDKITDRADDSKEVDKLKTEKKVVERSEDKKVEVGSQKKADKAEETKKETKDKITDRADGSKEVDQLKTEKKALEKPEDKKVEVDSQKKADKTEGTKKETEDKITDKADGSKEVDKLKTEKEAIEKPEDKKVELDSQKKADKTEGTKKETKDKITDKSEVSKEVDKLKTKKKVIEKPEDKKVEVDSQTEETKKETKDKITDKSEVSKEVDKLKSEKKVIEKPEDKKVEVDSQKKVDKTEKTKKETLIEANKQVKLIEESEGVKAPEGNKIEDVKKTSLKSELKVKAGVKDESIPVDTKEKELKIETEANKKTEVGEKKESSLETKTLQKEAKDQNKKAVENTDKVECKLEKLKDSNKGTESQKPVNEDSKKDSQSVKRVETGKNIKGVRKKSKELQTAEPDISADKIESIEKQLKSDVKSDSEKIHIEEKPNKEKVVQEKEQDTKEVKREIAKTLPRKESATEKTIEIETRKDVTSKQTIIEGSRKRLSKKDLEKTNAHDSVSDVTKQEYLVSSRNTYDVKDSCIETKEQEPEKRGRSFGREKKSFTSSNNEIEKEKKQLYIDESSTSDYSSASYSESYKIKKSQSYDTRQWITDSITRKGDLEESQSTLTSKYVTEKKAYESPSSTTPYEKSSYQRRQLASKPQFCGRLVDRTAAQGTRLKVTCSLTGSPEPTVQWFKDGNVISTSQDPRLYTRLSNGLASLEISEATVGDSGKYTCVARNSEGETSTTSTIKIFSYFESAPEAPVFTQNVRDQYKSSSDQLLIECRVKGHPLPTVTWLKDNQPLRVLSRYQQSVLTDGTCRLVIHGPEASDSGLYKCVAENAIWTEQTSGFVMFEGREKYLAESRSLTDTRLPRFTNILSDHVVREGGTVALQVAIKGTPRAEVTWYRGSDPLPKKSSRFRYMEDAGVYSLIMTNTSVTEAGTYTCRATNTYGHRDTCLNVTVVGGAAARGKPAMFVSRHDTSMSIAVGEDITISFRVSGDPKPRVTWMKGMKDITNNLRTLKETVNDYVRLSLKHATVMDSGTYFIQAKNIYGTDHAFVTVRVRQRARSLTPTRNLWSAPDTSTILRDIHESTRALVNDVPGPISGEATVSDSGKNWVSLTWGKPEQRGAAPVLAYRVEAWLLGSEGGAQWTELGVTPINSFDAFFLKPGAEYKFRITARNRYGWGESVTSTETITIGSASNFPPDIVRDLPGPLKALLGDNITLECEVSGDPPPTIQWLRDGQDVGTVAALTGRVFVSDSQLTHRLILKQLTDEDSGRYVCEAVNKMGRASTYARLLVVTDPRLLEADRKLKEGLVENQQSAPQLTMRLRDRRVQASYPVRLTCQVVGNPAPTVTWAHDGEPIAADDLHKTHSEADHFYTLEMSRTQLEDSGRYTVTAQNGLGAISCHCQLVVDKGIRAYVAPDFISELAPTITVAEGAELRLFAQVEAYPSVGIAWQRDGVRLRPCRRLVMTLDPEGRVELALAHVTSRDAGHYCCTATNAVGRAQTTCQVSVQGGGTVTPSVPSIISPTVPYSKQPRFVSKPLSSEAVEGETVVITCEVVGDPQPEVHWLRDWLKPGYYRDAPQFRQVAGGSQYSLEIPQVKLDFTGTYCVIARNPHGEAKAIISLQIYAKGQGKESSMVSGQVKHGKVETLPEIKRELRDLRCCDGDSATLECLVSATPPPSVRWEKDGKILPLGEDVEAEVDGEVARLTIKQVYPEDEGQYSCVAYNQLGRAVTSACLVVDVPEEKETLLSQQLTRPPGLLSTRSTPRSTPRNTPSPARSVSPIPARFREFSSPSFSRPKRIKMSSPKFYTVPHNRIAEEGETVRFQCAVAGHPTPWASWDKDGHIVTPSARLSVTERDDLRTLELREVTVEDAGLYRVTLENELGSVEATARLDVIGRQGSRTRSVRAWSAMRASPTFGRRLVGSAARVGGTFTLTCDVHASPSPVTSWYRNGEMLVMSERVVPSWDGRRARLELRGLQPEDAGVYTCVAENSVGTTQCSAQLQVLHTTDPSDADLQPPVFLQGLRPELTAAEGQPLELQTRLQGSSPLEVVWVKDGVEIPDCEDFRHVDYGDGRFGLRIADLFTADAGIYNCEAFNDHGDAITSGHLIVTDPSGTQEPEICFTKTPSPVMTRLRGQANFCARLQSKPLSHTAFSWTVAGRPISSTDERFTVTTEDDCCSILQISDVRTGDLGPVTCTARVCSPGVPPTTVSCGAELGLDCVAGGSPATLLRGPSDTTAMRGDRVLLKATYRGSPEPSVRWLKAGRELHTEGRVQITSRDGVSCLTISAITADDSGKYVVSVENPHGADCHFASVAVEGPPEPPSARPSVARGEGCVTVAWSSPAYDGGCVLTGYRLEMRTTDSQDWSVVADRCHSLSHVVRGLEAGQTYVFRVRAENIHGASESSAESFPFTLNSPVAREEEPESTLETHQVTLEPGDQFLERYSVHEELGKGRYGVVHKVTDLLTSHTMAAKFVRCIKKQDREKVQEEIDIMNCLRHPKLLQLSAAFENPKDIVMIMEYISGGELFERVVADDFTLTERDCILFLRQICEGVSYMHQSHVVHLDLKPENIMCHTRTSHRIKIIDFGLAQKLESNTPVRVLFGTPEFIPPEIINYEPIGVESDMWSVGVICYVLLSGLSPFMGDNDAETFANITRADYDFDDEAFDAISQDAKDFISSLLIKRKEKRLSAEECLQHKWLTQCDLTMSCVKLSTDKLKKFIIRRKWQKTGNAIRALGRMATLSAASRRNSSSSSTSPSPRPSLSMSRMSSLGEEECGSTKVSSRVRMCSERSDSGISDCSSITARPLLGKKYSICEEPESSFSRYTKPGVTVNTNLACDSVSFKPVVNTNPLCDSVNGKVTSDISAAAKKRTTSSLRPFTDSPVKAPSPTLQKDAKMFSKSENFQKAIAFWKQ